jgi:5-methylthioadenosine/S-adenosylhomocysteine deaminase
MRCLIIENGAVLTCDRADRYLARGRIAIQDGRITRVEELPGGRSDAPPPTPPPREDASSERVDASGSLILPGLINTHTHLWLSLLRGTSDDLTLFPWLRDIGPRSGAMSEPDLVRATYFGLAESLRSGTTCVCECCRYAPDLTARIAEELGCRVVVGGMPPSEMLGAPVPHDYPHLVSRTRTAVERHRDERHLVSLWLGAHSVYNCSPAFLKEAKRQANGCGCDFYLHLAECRDEVEVVRQRSGKTPVQYAADLGLLDHRTVAAHCVWMTDEDVHLFRQSGARIAHCPVSNAKLGSGVAPISRYRRAGIAVGLGTDSMVSNNTLSMFQEMRFAVLIQRAVAHDATALSAAEALRMATCDAARVLGLERELGTIEEGKRADLLLLRSTRPGPLTRDVAVSDVVYAAQRDEIEAVYVEGERVVDRGRLTRIDEPALRARIRGGTQCGVG